MKKNYVFDTNVLIHDPNAIFRFEDNDIYIPIYVLEELDGLKNDQGEKGKSARESVRYLDEFRTRGNFTDGIKIDENDSKSGSLFIYTPKELVKLTIATEDKKDHLILQSAINIKNDSQDGVKTILVTMDMNLRVRAEALGIQVAPYEHQSVDIKDLGNKYVTIDLDPELFSDLVSNGKGYCELPEDQDFDLNTSAKIICGGNEKQSVLGRVKLLDGKKVVKKLAKHKSIMGISPKNIEQNFAIDLLLDPDIKLVSLMGTAGSGKTMLTTACALHMVMEGGYNKVLIARPVVPMGNDIGYIPGDINDKLRPYMQPIYDNLDYILMNAGSKNRYAKNADELFEQGYIEIEPLVYIRGRSIINQIMIIDEAQSLTTHEIKTIISRCGEGTKIIFTGDIHQIDNPYVTKESNGLSVIVKKIRDNAIVGHILLEKGERSELANIAVEYL